MTKLIKTVMFEAPASKVWEFLTDKDKLGIWYHPAEANLEVDKDYALISTGDDGEKKRLIWGRVLEMQPHDRLVTTFCIAPFEGGETTLTWELQEASGGTLLTLTHDGIAEAAGEAALPLMMALDKGWDGHFEDFRAAA